MTFFLRLTTTENTDDGLPASCECGPVTVSRAMIQQAIGRGQRTLHLP